MRTAWFGGTVVTTAANSLDADLPFPLSQLLDLAIEALATKPFEARIQAAKQVRERPKRGKSRIFDVEAQHHGN